MPMAATKVRSSEWASPRRSRTSTSKSSSAPISPRASLSCPSAGSSSARSPGWDDAGVSPKTGNVSVARRWLSYASPPSVSCCESYAIQSDVPGQTLRPRQNLAHPLDQLGLGGCELSALAQLQIVGAVLGAFRELGAEFQVADRDLRAAGRVALVRALDDGAAASALVGVFELGVHAALTEIELGGDLRAAQGGDEALGARHRRRVAVEGEDDDGARRFGRLDDRAVDGAR